MNDATLPAAGLAAAALPVSTRVMNLATFLTQSARRLPDQVALVMGERHWTWAEFEARTDALAVALQDRLGLKKGDRVRKGQVIGVVSEGTHCLAAVRACVHWGVRLGDDYVHPLPFVGAQRPSVLLPVPE